MNYLKTLEEAKEFLSNDKCEEFTTGTLSAKIEDNGEDVLYIVRSYGVAIAEVSPFIHNGYVYPNAYSHSKTTSKHANIVKRAWGVK